MKVLSLFAAAALAVSSFQMVQAADLTSADEIVKQANIASYYAGKDGRAEARMKIIDAQGRNQLRQFTILRRSRKPGGEQDLMVFFSRPSDVRNTVFRVVRHPGADDDRWLYLPGLDLVKRISAGDKRTSFVGSDFFYEDVSGRNPSEDNHKLLETAGEYYVLESKPVDPKSVEFVSYKSWISKATLLPMKVEYTDSRGKIYRTMEVVKVDTIQGHPTVLQAQISNLERGSKTLMQMRGVKYDIGLPQDIFGERSLRKPPQQWLKK
ncbi:outer membrane lipoprotein-sorting protein [Sansalvadorimonas sp. 2012CJ34-2]|uniref:Outer membrane lipoprotein-sorting protein n=1 Tax=Parendozoicomonas callyspongiae TaxID=2942213 RepID=A0ABT0PDZ0_9GAMM|nr:outer membrane lipoprotein-sorting protein [Sansalvadorimonas sp. 2012CJ34-2]MCL6269579.1 outer membrane lipoprotein-sorting protein [Sansalvadorimonas sp. 2012CJ34-2]